MKKLITASLAASLAAAMLGIGAGAASFAKTQTYSDGTFTDVPGSEWYAPEVKNTYELGLMKGTGAGLFEPDGSVTVAEAITMASRAAAIYAGEEIPAAGGEWYQMYVNYAASKGLFAEGAFSQADYDRPAKRREVASLFASALPADYFTAKNDVKAIPDVPSSMPYAEKLLMLYRAGVVMGSDNFGNFRPEDSILRAETAAIINRVALPDNRLAKSLDIISGDDAYTLCNNSTMNGSKEGINSGWTLDNRGGAPRTGLLDNYGPIVDVRKDAGAAYIRHFNKTSTGVITLDTKVLANGAGAFLEYRNEADMPVYHIETFIDGWKLLNADGSFTKVRDVIEREGTLQFKVILDLDNDRVSTYINEEYLGTVPTLTSGEDTNIYNFRFGTTDAGIPVLNPGAVQITANYGLFEQFSWTRDENKPFGWTLHNATGSGSLNLNKDGTAATSFDPVSGDVIAETIMLLPDGEHVSYDLMSGTKKVVSFANDDTNFTVNGTAVYENYYKNVWYRLRFELDTAAMTVDVKVNGIYVAKDIPFAESATSVDNLLVANGGDGKVTFDDFKVFRRIEHEDYVPVPVVPKGEEKYTVGMNVCSLWTNGSHFGWSCVSAYPDPQPVLGYYDEGNPETADWEIKYLVEHGIDFGAYCVYFSATSGPLRLDASHLFNGFQNAKYSDMSKYCIIWEAANAQSPSSIEAWENNYVPFFIENFFKDPRYMVIDNMPVVCVFGAGNIGSRVGGNNKVKDMFEYLDEEVKKLGFDGVIWLANGSASDSLGTLGFDGAYAYNWGNTGNTVATNKNSILSSAKNTSVYTVPCISVGFNNIPWAYTRYPMMTKEDYKTCHEWVRDEYFKTYPKEDWQKNFVMLSTWNEYGEGTYIMPSNDEKGFRYIDVIREIYTDEKEDAAVDTIPTNEQRYRINHLYPQYYRLLRKQGYYKEEFKAEDMELVGKIDYSEYQGVLGWSMDNIKQDADGFTGTSNGSDPIVVIQNYKGDTINLDEVDAIRFTVKTPKGNGIQFFYTTSESGSWSEDKSKGGFSAESDDFATYTIDCSTLKNFTGRLSGVRIDPSGAAGITSTVKSVEFLKFTAHDDPKVITINGQKVEMQLPMQEAANGDKLIAFDPVVGLDYRLDLYHLWNMDERILSLWNKDHEVIFTVGKDTYTLDGAEKKLPYTILDLDGLPLLPIKQLCADLGYKYDDAEGINIETISADYMKVTTSGVPYQWEFDNVGNTEGWGSTFMSLLVTDGYMSCESMSTSTDPTITHPKNIKMAAEGYTKLEYRVRWNYDRKDTKQQLVMYYITNKDTTWNEAKTLKIDLPSADSGGEFMEFSYELAKQPLWQDTITSLRFDPFNSTGMIDIDYIRFIPDENYTPPEVDEVDYDKFAIANGDAEKAGGFNSSNGNISIVKDPSNGDNKCYRNLPKGDVKVWLYTEQPVTYTAGATYKVECDVRLASHGATTDLEDSFGAVILCNAQYIDAAGSKDHVASSRKTLTAGDGWQHWAFEFTVPKTATDRSGDVFSFYSDPVKELGVGYYLDNVVVTEVLPQ